LIKKHNNPIPMVDIIIEKNGHIVLVKRGLDPYKGKLAIPGGYVEYGETVEDAAVREAREETSLKIRLDHILGVYSDPNRDPRGHRISITFIAKPIEGKLKAGSDAMDVNWYNLSKIDTRNMAFDHGRIIEDYKKWKKLKETYWSTR
jgi:8-oxo-dGTP diphosphatase